MTNLTMTSPIALGLRLELAWQDGQLIRALLSDGRH